MTALIAPKERTLYWVTVLDDTGAEHELTVVRRRGQSVEEAAAEECPSWGIRFASLERWEVAE